MDALTVYIEGIGWWSSGVADWNAAAALLRDAAAWPRDESCKPAAQQLSAGERRRAPAPVLIACEVGAQACAMAARDGAGLPCVFASMHGDLAITHAMCTTLAAEPYALSPTKFHNSVHNAAAGYWTVATHNHAASSAVSAWCGSFAAGLLEAAAQALAEDTPVLLVAGDVVAQGPLVAVVDSPLSFGAALLLAPARSAHTRARLQLRHRTQESAPLELTPLADVLPLFAALAAGRPAALQLRTGVHGALAIEVAA